MTINSTKGRPTVERTSRERPAALQAGRAGVPWLTVLPLAVVLAYGDGFWLTSLRGAVGAIERTQGPFTIWLRESTLVLPLFIFAVLGALTLALRWFGPVLRKPRTVVATGLLVAAGATLVAIAEMAASSAYDYHLQSSQLQLMSSMNGTSPTASALAQQASLELQLHALGYGSAILLATNLVLVGWVVAVRGGRLNVSAIRQSAAGRLPQIAHRSRVDDLRPLLAAGLIGSAAIHAAVVPQHLSEWGAAGVFFIVLAAAEVAVAALLLVRLQPAVLLAAAVVSLGPLALWLYSRTVGMPFGPEAGIPEQVGLADIVACALEVGTLLAAIVLLRGKGWLERPAWSAHASRLTLVMIIALTAIGLAGSGLPVIDDFGGVQHETAMTSQQ